MTQEQLGKRFYDIPWAAENQIEATCSRYLMTPEGMVGPLVVAAKMISWTAFGRVLFSPYVSGPILDILHHEAD